LFCGLQKNLFSSGIFLICLSLSIVISKWFLILVTAAENEEDSDSDTDTEDKGELSLFYLIETQISHNVTRFVFCSQDGDENLV
jgi:type IV secretory pathway TrbL component